MRLWAALGLDDAAADFAGYGLGCIRLLGGIDGIWLDARSGRNQLSEEGGVGTIDRLHGQCRRPGPPTVNPVGSVAGGSLIAVAYIIHVPRKTAWSRRVGKSECRRAGTSRPAMENQRDAGNCDEAPASGHDPI